jgi:uncharacterized membrane protein HdeD (DUF308 family)
MIRSIFNANNFSTNYKGNGLLFSGLFLILIGLVIIAFPEILIVFIASVFITSGAIIIYLGWKWRKQQKNIIEININQNA